MILYMCRLENSINLLLLGAGAIEKVSTQALYGGTANHSIVCDCIDIVQVALHRRISIGKTCIHKLHQHWQKKRHLESCACNCRREFWSCFALQDQKEGMAAFSEKRKPDFKNL